MQAAFLLIFSSIANCRVYRKTSQSNTQWPAFMYRTVASMMENSFECAAICTIESQICEGYLLKDSSCHLGNSSNLNAVGPQSESAEVFMVVSKCYNLESKHKI